jgi:hypothetical protein
MLLPGAGQSVVAVTSRRRLPAAAGDGAQFIHVGPLPAEAEDLPAASWQHNAERVASVAAASADLLAEYHEQVYDQTVKLVSEVTDADLDRVVEVRWTPHVTLAVRLVSVLDDDMQHVGQAAYVRGIVRRRG